MTTKEYIEKKNELVFKMTGLTLVPEDQIVDTKYIDKFAAVEYLSKFNCPYCLAYLNKDCKDCPMFEAGKHCLSMDSTYSKVEEKLQFNNKFKVGSHGFTVIPGLYELGVKYRESNKGK